MKRNPANSETRAVIAAVMGRYPIMLGATPAWRPLRSAPFGLKIALPQGGFPVGDDWAIHGGARKPRGESIQSSFFFKKLVVH